MVFVFIDQPLFALASVGYFHSISFCAASGALSSLLADGRHGRMPSYVEILTCLEMAKDARELPADITGSGVPNR